MDPTFVKVFCWPPIFIQAVFFFKYNHRRYTEVLLVLVYELLNFMITESLQM